MKIQLSKNSKNDEYDSVSWVYLDKKVCLNFDCEVYAVHASKIDRVVVEKCEDNKICFFKLNGEMDFESDIPCIEGYKYRGINKNIESKTGVSLLFYPVGQGKGNAWGDIEQYELIASSDCLGGFIDIYR